MHWQSSSDKWWRQRGRINRESREHWSKQRAEPVQGWWLHWLQDQQWYVRSFSCHRLKDEPLRIVSWNAFVFCTISLYRTGPADKPCRLQTVGSFGVDQWLREWNFLRLCGFSGAIKQHQGMSHSCPPGNSRYNLLLSENKKKQVNRVFWNLNILDRLFLKDQLWPQVPVVKTNGFQNGHVTLQSSPNRLEVGMEGRQVGAGGGGEGGEGAEDRKGQGPLRRNRDLGREGPYNSWREREWTLNSLQNIHVSLTSLTLTPSHGQNNMKPSDRNRFQNLRNDYTYKS